jgi:hypothetical protein
MSRRSEKRIVHFSLDVNAWLSRTPTVSEARPGCCPGCGAAGQVLGQRRTLVGHGVRERQVRGPLTPDAAAAVAIVVVRRYRCLECNAVITVAPRGVASRRHFSASAIGVALYLYGVLGASAVEVSRRIGLWGARPGAWRTLFRWSAAIDSATLFASAHIRASPAKHTLRQRAQRAAMTLGSLSPAGSTALLSRVFVGAALSG